MVRLNGRFPLYQVIMALGRDPTDSHGTSYLRSATNGVGGDIIFALSGFTSMGSSSGGGGQYRGKKVSAAARSRGYVTIPEKKKEKTDREC